MSAVLVLLLAGAAWAQEEEPAPRMPPPQQESEAETVAAAIAERFQFGSYGRVGVGSDLHGGTGQQVRLIAHPPRLLETPYAELDLAYTHEVSSSGTVFATQMTLALGERLFHFTGDFAADLAIRNLYLEVRNAGLENLSLWAGSRMYRGDDIYLLDFWPLDEQNTVGGGAAYFFGASSVRLHFGLNRLEDEFQTQTITVPGEEFGTREVLLLDRQRSVVSLRGEHNLLLTEALNLKLVLYGEAQAIPGGSRETDGGERERLPADSGWLLGAEGSLYGFGPNSHLNATVRYASGLAAYDELAVPYGLDSDKKAKGARELLLALSGNFEFRERLGLLLGLYARNFVDADPNVYDRDDLWELGAALRPAWFFTEHLGLLAEVNMQVARPHGLSPETGAQEAPLAFEFGIMPVISLGRGSYARPQLRLIYALTVLNDAALRTFAPEDPQRDHRLRHYLGVGVEWWFHSSRYGM